MRDNTSRNSPLQRSGSEADEVWQGSVHTISHVGKKELKSNEVRYCWNELPYNEKLKERARDLRKAGNLSEMILWNQIKHKKLANTEFTRQKIIGNYIVDFYCKELGLVIEIDGCSHDGKEEYDARRDAYLIGLQLTMLHIPDYEVRKNLEGVLEYIKDQINKIAVTHSPL